MRGGASSGPVHQHTVGTGGCTKGSGGVYGCSAWARMQRATPLPPSPPLPARPASCSPAAPTCAYHVYDYEDGRAPALVLLCPFEQLVQVVPSPQGQANRNHQSDEQRHAREPEYPSRFTAALALPLTVRRERLPQWLVGQHVGLAYRKRAAAGSARESHVLSATGIQKRPAWPLPPHEQRCQGESAFSFTKQKKAGATYTKGFFCLRKPGEKPFEWGG